MERQLLEVPPSRAQELELGDGEVGGPSQDSGGSILAHGTVWWVEDVLLHAG